MRLPVGEAIEWLWKLFNTDSEHLTQVGGLQLKCIRCERRFEIWTRDDLTRYLDHLTNDGGPCSHQVE